ncbi:MAG: hypothetical protein KAR39_04555 [Thermoplasmata archaeon]|nr:hypothetical protein [Thermoplasmata archaeon]
MKYVLVTNYNDWEGFYVDGKLIMEGHRVRREKMLKHMGITLNTIETKEGWLEDRGSLPQNLSDVEEM